MASVAVPQTVYVRWYCKSCKYHHEVRANKAHIDSIPAYSVIDLGTTDLRCKKLRYKEEETVADKQVYKVGQRVHVVCDDGTEMIGFVNSVTRAGAHISVLSLGRTLWVSTTASGHTITILSEPRPDEPQGLGAVVEAEYKDYGRQEWVSVRGKGESRNRWVCIPYWGFIDWDMLTDPVVLSEGMLPT